MLELVAAKAWRPLAAYLGGGSSEFITFFKKMLVGHGRLLGEPLETLVHMLYSLA